MQSQQEAAVKKSKRELEKIYKNGLAIYQESSPMSEKNKLAVQLFKIAAQEGYLPAQIYLSGCYFQGIGVRKNIKAAQKWYTLIAEQGIISVQYKLATSYLHSNDSGIPDIDKCIYWLKRVISNREAIEVIDEQEYRYTVHGRELSSSEIKQEAINLLVSLTCKSIEIEALQHDPPDLRSPEEIESLLNAKINPSALRELGLSYYNQEQFSFSSNDKKALYCGNYRIQNTAFPEICKSAPPAKLPSCYPSMSNINSRCVQKKPGT